MFIVFEGIDGCGKTTQVEMLADWLKTVGFDVITVREPGGTWVSESIRDILHDNNEAHDDLHYMTELLLFNAARAELVNKVIIPHLRKPKGIVIADRYIHSTYAYQGYGRGINLDVIKSIVDIATRNLIPDIQFNLNISIPSAKSRRLSRLKPGDWVNKWDLMADEFYEQVRIGYLDLMQDYCFSINAENPPAAILFNIKQY